MKPGMEARTHGARTLVCILREGSRGDSRYSNPERFHSAFRLQSHRDHKSQQTFLDDSKQSVPLCLLGETCRRMGVWACRGPGRLGLHFREAANGEARTPFNYRPQPRAQESPSSRTITISERERSPRRATEFSNAAERQTLNAER
jgi:hypothetical protein